MDRMNEYIGAAYLFAMVVLVLVASNWARGKGDKGGK